jgi:hypothetical protein
MRLFISDYRCEWILKGESLLNFQENYKINSANRIGDLLYWTDGYEGTPFVDYNPPRKINVVKACGYTNPYSATRTYRKGEYAGYNGKTYRFVSNNPVTNILPTNTTYWAVANVGVYASITEQILDRIKYPPVNNMTVEYGNDEAYGVNNLRGNLWQFRYRYIYSDNEQSVWFVISNMPFPQGEEMGGGTYEADQTINNRLVCTIYSGGAEVRTIEISVRNGNDGLWTVIKRIEKYDIDGNVLYLNDIPITFYFYNDINGGVLDQDDVARLYDAIPQISARQELIEKNRILDADYIEGYDPINIDVGLSYSKRGIDITGGAPTIQTYYGYSGIARTGAWFYLPDPIPNGMILLCAVWRYFVPVSSYPFNINSLPFTTGCEYFPITIRVLGDETTSEFRERLASAITEETDMTSYYEPLLNSRVFINTTIVYDNLGNEIGTYVPATLRCVWLPEMDKYASFKQGATHLFGIVYYDRALRCGSVLTSETSSIYIPYPTQDGTDVPSFITPSRLNTAHVHWTISHRPPIWARYYQWVYGKSNVEWFLDFGLPMHAFAISNAPPAIYVDLNAGIIDMKTILPQNILQTYVWQSGDRLRFLSVSSDNWYAYQDLCDEYIDVEILGTEYRSGDGSYLYDDSDTPAVITDADGNKVKAPASLRLKLPQFSLSDLGIDTTDDSRIVVIEVYRPRKKATEDSIEIYYEIDGLYEILDPHTDNRRHGGYTSVDDQYFVNNVCVVPASGTFNYIGSPQSYSISSDVYVKLRLSKFNLVPVEAMEFSDVYNMTYNSIGRPQIVNRNFRRIEYRSNILHSGLYIENTLTNNLSKVNSSDYISLAEKYGSINFMREVGFTLKVLQQYKSTSLYIGREGLQQAKLSGVDVVASKSEILSSPMVSETDYGTAFSSGCLKYLRNIYFYDAYNGVIVRDAPNGMFPISDYGIKDFIRDKSKTFIAHGLDNVSVYSAYDETFNLVFFSFLDSADATQNFTIAFHEPTNKWISFYDFQPEFYGCLGSLMTSWESEKLWLHNSGTRMNFYGTQYTQRVKVAANKDPLKVKAFKAIVLDSNKIWNAGTNGDIVILQNGSLLSGASSKLPESWFELREGKYYSNFGRNMLSNGVTPQEADLIDGDELRGSSMGITLRNANTDETKLFGVIVESTYSPKSG